MPIMMSPEDRKQEKVRENRLRRVAHRKGLRLMKSRSRTFTELNYGSYQIVDPTDDDYPVAGDFRMGKGLTLDEVEEHLHSYTPAKNELPADDTRMSIDELLDWV